MKTVKLVDARDGAALVEYLDEDGALVRKTVPVESVAGNKVDPEMLELGIVYGADWDSLAERMAIAPEIAEEFHRIGIWTPEDLMALSAKARAGLDRVIVVPLMEALINYSREV